MNSPYGGRYIRTTRAGEVRSPGGLSTGSPSQFGVLGPQPLDLRGLRRRPRRARRGAEGLSNAETAARLVISEHTVERHVSRLPAKTSCRYRAVLARHVTS
ncbi:helix-turn-helix domain-containing protein [Streptomyces sp. NPDC054834]